MSISLYHYWRSSTSIRVRWALAIKGVDYDSEHVNLLTADAKSDEYLKKNPNGYVPTLEIEGNFLGESMAIMEFLEERFPAPSIIPGDVYVKANIRQLAELINSGVQPLHNLSVMKKVSDVKEEQLSWNQHWIRRGFAAYEGLLTNYRQGEPKFSLTDEPTIADICLVASMYSGQRFGVELNEFSLLEQIYNAAMENRAYQVAAPEKFKPK